MPTCIIVGASRGIGLEFVRQLLARGDRVIATARGVAQASQLWSLAGKATYGACTILPCDVTVEESIDSFVREVKNLPDLTRIDYVVLNAGVLKYPNRATEISFDDFAYHLHTNTIGPIITAQRLLQTSIPIGTIMFMSSDSGSTAQFREFEDGFAAYAASKAALNQMLRHMASELRRKQNSTIILAMHPGEVSTDMANVSLDWDVEGIITPAESVAGMLRVIPTKRTAHSGTFWTWEGKEYPW
ncbi:3-oxoacyl-reductase [Xylona heveae TC161]|uniref:3-oxoacyl-reductase n=1 Tax=Xylona heveae (strain CBS 132557 / TC161) TaxID=1328760 RepID=A0A165A6W1_XYLHT|nr:3-oxoacyl-reductase [Xylona heveae TC161]KZF20037.1 3-oxoacyl-reductase [Xylona heveae TC161]